MTPSDEEDRLLAAALEVWHLLGPRPPEPSRCPSLSEFAGLARGKPLNVDVRAHVYGDEEKKPCTRCQKHVADILEALRRSAPPEVSEPSPPAEPPVVESGARIRVRWPGERESVSEVSLLDIGFSAGFSPAGEAGNRSSDPTSPQPKQESSESRHVTSSDPALSVTLSREDGEVWLDLAHSHLTSGSLFLVTLVDSATPEKMWRMYVMGRMGFLEVRTVARVRVEADRPSGIPDITVKHIESPSRIPASDAKLLRKAFEKARRDDPTAVPVWKAWAIAGRRAEGLPRELEAALTEISEQSDADESQSGVYCFTPASRNGDVSRWFEELCGKNANGPRDQFVRRNAWRELSARGALFQSLHSAVGNGDLDSLHRAWEFVSDPSVEPYLAYYYSTERGLSQLKVTVPQLYAALRGSVGAALAALSARNRDTGSAERWVRSAAAAWNGQSSAGLAMKLEWPKLPSVPEELLDYLFRNWFQTHDAGSHVGAVHDYTRALLGKPRKASAVFACPVVGARRDDGFDAALTVELIRDGSGQFYPDPVSVECVPMTREFLDMLPKALSAAVQAHLRRTKRVGDASPLGGVDVRWFIELKPGGGALPVLHGDSLGAALAVSLCQLLRASEMPTRKRPDSPSWILTAGIDGDGNLIEVGRIREKALAAAKFFSDHQLPAGRLFVHSKNAKEAREVLAKSFHDPDTTQSAATVDDVLKLIKPNRMWSWLRICAVAAVLALGTVGGISAAVILGGEQKQIPDSEEFKVLERYNFASGLLGDTGDVASAPLPELVRFTYRTKGSGPHHWDWRFIDSKPNPQPAYFGGVMGLNPTNAWGTKPECGFDLRQFRGGRVCWEARATKDSDLQTVHTQFSIGGVNWIWDEATGKQVNAPYPDTMPQSFLGGPKALTPEWQEFTHELPTEEAYFKRVVGGFGWTVGWDNNGVEKTDEGKPVQVRKLEIEVRNVRYVKKQQ